MTAPAMKKAALGVVVSKLWRGTNNGAHDGGLVENDTHVARRRLSPDRATMAVRRRTTARELGGLLSQRRMTAAPALLGNVAFSLDGIRTHGLIAPALDQSCGLMPCGKPLRLPFPLTRSANPHGVAHLLAEVSGFRQLVKGAQP